MKKCEYCGRENADEAAQCHGCGQEWFTPIVSQPVSEQEIRIRKKQLTFRLLVALLMGLAVAGLSLDVSWRSARQNNLARQEQWRTQRQLAELDHALINYRKEFHALPHSLNQLMTNGMSMRWFNDDKIFVDGWKREFLFSPVEPNGLVTSYGRDGKPGGIGLDCDLTNINPKPMAAVPTFYQFFFDMPVRGMINSCFVFGGLAFLLSFFTVRKPDFTFSGIFTLSEVGKVLARITW